MVSSICLSLPSTVLYSRCYNTGMKKLLKILAVATFGVFCFVVGVTYQHNINLRNPVTVQVVKHRPYSQEVLWSHIQNYKSKQGLQPYIEDQKLCEYADTRLEQVKSDYEHTGYENTALAFHELTGFMYSGENLASFIYMSNQEPKEENELSRWLASPTHRKNLDNALYTHSCLRCNQTYCVQLFAGY